MVKMFAAVCSVLLLIPVTKADDASNSSSTKGGKPSKSAPADHSQKKGEIVPDQKALDPGEQIPIADSFDFPVGAPNGDGYHVERGFSEHGFPGELWNGDGGGDTDRGDPVSSIANGLVVYAHDAQKGWGNVVIVRHQYRDEDGTLQMIDSLYGRLLTINVTQGETVKRGQLLGSIGNGPMNMYSAMLHFEIRKNIRILMNRRGFEKTFNNYHSPSHFIKSRRKKA